MDTTKELEKFNPTVADLTAMVEATKGITATDLKDKKQLEIVHDKRMELRDARVKITKIGKELRADAITFQKAVIAQEEKLIGIIEPEEKRLAEIEEEAKALAIREERLEKLPARKARLADLQVEGRVMLVVSDEQLLSMDSEQFEAHYNSVVAEKNEIERQEQLRKQTELEQEIARKRQEEQSKLDEERAKLNADREKLEQEKLAEEHKKQIREAEEKARFEEKEKIEREAIEKEEQRKHIEQMEAEEAKKKAEQEQKRQEFIVWRASLGWTEETKADFKVEKTDEGYVLFKKLGVFKN